MSKKHRRRARADILAKRQADDERHATMKPTSPPTRLEPAALTLLYNPFKPQPRSPGGVILIRPGRGNPAAVKEE